MRMNKDLRSALKVLTEFYTDTVADDFGVFQTPGPTTPEVDEAWWFVNEAVEGGGDAS